MVSTFARTKKLEALMSTKAIGRPISVKDKAAASTIMVTYTSASGREEKNMELEISSIREEISIVENGETT